MKLGYIRISSIDQNFARQDLGQVDKLFQDTKSGSTTDRIELQKRIEFARSGDEVICFSIDRLARNLSDLQNIVSTLNDKGVSVHFLSENLVFTKEGDNPFAKLQLQLLGSFAEFERNIIKRRQREGIEAAKLKGVYQGRKRTISAKKVKQLLKEGMSKAEIAKAMNISRQSVYRCLAT